jgi:hypothetical protein
MLRKRGIHLCVCLFADVCCAFADVCMRRTLTSVLRKEACTSVPQPALRMHTSANRHTTALRMHTSANRHTLCSAARWSKLSACIRQQTRSIRQQIGIHSVPQHAGQKGNCCLTKKKMLCMCPSCCVCFEACAHIPHSIRIRLTYARRMLTYAVRLLTYADGRGSRATAC